MKPFTTAWLLLMMTFTTALGLSIGSGSAVAQDSSGRQTAKVRILCSDALDAMKDLVPQFERAIGRPIEIQYHRTAVLKQKIEAGEPFDVAVFAVNAIDDLVKEGKLVAATRADVARTGIGLGIRAGMPKPDISTPDAVKRVLLNAKSVAHAREGAARPFIEKIYDRLGINNEMGPKKMLLDERGAPQVMVSEGKAELVITPISEIIPYPGVQLVGPFPAELQSYLEFAAGVSTKSQNPQAAAELVKLMSGPTVVATFKAKGLEPMRH